MTLFIAIAALLGAVTLGAVLAPMLGPRRSEAARAEKDMAVFRDQLAEVERDHARGTLSDSELAGAKAEISRRLLAAGDRAEHASALEPAPRGASRIAVGLAVLALPAIAVGVYWAEGAPGLPDQPFAERAASAPQRPTQAQAEAQADVAPAPEPQGEEAEFADLITRLEGIVAERPDDPQGRRLLANGLMRLGRHGEAWPHFAALIEMMGAEAEPTLYATQAEAMILAAGGYVSPEAEGVLAQALIREPGNPIARYYQGIALAQGGALGSAVEVWRGLLADSGPEAPWRPTLEGLLARAEAELESAGAARAGRAAPAASGPQPDSPPGPSQAEIDAAAAMSAEDRQAMIESMVERLDTRLAEEGGEPEEWLRLVTVYVRLGRMEDARAAYERSQAALDGSAASFVRQEALLLGVIEE